MFCEKCGAKLIDDSRFCEFCGARAPSIEREVNTQRTALATNANPNSGATQEKLRIPQPSGRLSILVSGIFYLFLSLIRHGESGISLAYFLSSSVLCFGVLPIFSGLFLFFFKLVKIGVAGIFIALLMQGWWWYLSFPLLNFWDVENTMRFQGIQLISSGLFLAGCCRFIFHLIYHSKRIANDSAYQQ